MNRKDLEALLKKTEEKIKEQQMLLKDLSKRLEALEEQEKERKNYISSKEIIDLVFKKIGKTLNMSTIKRWADEGYLGEVIDEKEKFWALRSKQGKKRFLYPKVDTFHFLYEKGYLLPEFDVLDRVLVKLPSDEAVIGIVIDAYLHKGQFFYTIQREGSFERLNDVKESNLANAAEELMNQ
ncbi:hypothetical protein [Bacillus badius]|uniref:Uncharacterized protein n=1 Tax=Bacillus badius TaxID=1455 RepID=A0ABR5B0S3_BACBA|nr:hypothetical protein [Bacillus badius]KIL73209.1 hypothetical protein SD78_3397 [Bacillus badius]KIL80221.1 hypothetical protein SD77_0069 [Bacillus badius]KZR56852.1 hypothetical protein A3781_06245 [Bacillus badius]MED4717003.1 hypothetical protein [Bacillus badius]